METRYVANSGSDVACPTCGEPLCDDKNEPHGVYDCLANVKSERDRLYNVVHRPLNNAFLQGVSVEFEYQKSRLDVKDDEKTPSEWYWTLGYLAGKALYCSLANDIEKAKHHCITAAALLWHWHSRL